MNNHNDYNKDTFWTSYDEKHRKVRYYINLNDIMIEVDKEVYQTMFNSYRKSLRLMKQHDENMIVSLDSDQFGNGLYSILSANIDIEKDVNDHFIAENIQRAISNLDEIDKKIIVGLFYENKTETTIGNELGISQQAVQKRKQKILKKLREFIGDIADDLKEL